MTHDANTMKVTYQLTRDDLVALIAYHQQSSPAARKQAIGCVAVAFCAMMILPVGILLTRDKPVLETAMDIWPLWLGPILFGILAAPYMRWQARQMSSRMLSEGQNKGFYGQCELEVGTDALTEIRPSGSTVRNWSSVERLVTTPSHLFIYTGGIEAYVVPRRAFRGDSEFSEFVDAIAGRSGVRIEANG
jgi:hypothetical protein